VKDPGERVKRLKIFIGNHADHPYRFIAYKRAFDALSTELKGDAGAAEFMAASLAKEIDPHGRGELLLMRFAYLMERDEAAAIAFADSMLLAEHSPRLFLFMGYDLMDPKMDPDRAVKCFLKAADLSPPPYAKRYATALAGSVLKAQGRLAEAKRYLTAAAGDYHADGLLAGMLWQEGRREEAIELYIRSAARMPGMRESVRLDSLYALVYPGGKDLDSRIMSSRIGDEGPMPEGVFVDLRGKRHDLSKLKGTKIVLYALSPA
jgi:tetratricopeptide (TPR) repeat protein